MPGKPWLKYQTADQSNQNEPQKMGQPWLKYQNAPIQPEVGLEQAVDTWGGKVRDFADATADSLPAIGGIVGGTVGLPAGTIAGPLGAEAGRAVGAGIGGYLGKAGQNLYNTHFRPEKTPKSNSEYLTGPVEEGMNQATAEAVGQRLTKLAAPIIGAGVGGYLGHKATEDGSDEEKVSGPIAGAAAGALVGKNKTAIKDKSGQVFDWIAKKGGKIAGNIPEHFTEEYLKRKGQLNPRSSTDIMDEIGQMRTAKEQAVKGAEKRVDNSQVFHKTREQELKDQAKQYREQFEAKVNNSKFETAQKANAAKEEFKNAATLQKEGLKGKTLSPIREDIFDGMRGLKEQVTHGSADAYSILGDQKGQLNITPIVNTLKKGMNDLKIRGTPISDTAAASIQNLMVLEERLKKVGKIIRFPEAKAIIQQLDHDIGWDRPTGQFFPQAEAVKRQMRRQFDEILKHVTPYAKKMEKVAEDSRLLKELSEKFGDEETAIRTLSQLASEKGRLVDLPLLQALEKKTGKNFGPSLSDYLHTQGILKNPSKLKALSETLPEYGKMTKAEADALRFSDPKYKQLQQNVINKSHPQVQLEKHKLEAQKSLEKNTAELEKAGEEFEPLAPFSHGNIEAKTKALTGARNYHSTKLFGDLDKATGKPFTQEIKDRAILDQFTKGDPQGSRKTLMGKLAGGAIGAGLGYAAGENSGAAALGGLAGFALDRYSGQVIKALLDGRIAAPEAVKSLSAKYGKYAPILIHSALSGPDTFKTTLSILSKNPEFRANMDQ